VPAIDKVKEAAVMSASEGKVERSNLKRLAVDVSDTAIIVQAPHVLLFANKALFAVAIIELVTVAPNDAPSKAALTTKRK